jgi:hypothetical protein
MWKLTTVVFFSCNSCPSARPDTWGLFLHENNKGQWELECYQCQCLNDYHILNLNASVYNFIFQGVYIHQTYCNTLHINYYFFVTLNSNSISGCLIDEISRSHTIRHTRARENTHTHTHTQYDSSEPMISSSQGSIPTQHTTNIKD